MPSKKHKPEEIIGKMREVEIVLAQGASTAEACRRIAVSEQTYYRWRKEYGGLKTDQARRMSAEVGSSASHLAFTAAPPRTGRPAACAGSWRSCRCKAHQQAHSISAG
jgi:transposase-like protein